MRRLLLDTHALLWVLDDDDALGEPLGVRLSTRATTCS